MWGEKEHADGERITSRRRASVWTPALELLTRNHSDISERRAKDVIYGRVLCLSVFMLLAESWGTLHSFAQQYFPVRLRSLPWCARGCHTFPGPTPSWNLLKLCFSLMCFKVLFREILWWQLEQSQREHYLKYICNFSILILKTIPKF